MSEDQANPTSPDTPPPEPSNNGTEADSLFSVSPTLIEQLGTGLIKNGAWGLAFGFIFIYCLRVQFHTYLSLKDILVPGIVLGIMFWATTRFLWYLRNKLVHWFQTGCVPLIHWPTSQSTVKAVHLLVTALCIGVIGFLFFRCTMAFRGAPSAEALSEKEMPMDEDPSGANAFRTLTVPLSGTWETPADLASSRFFLIDPAMSQYTGFGAAPRHLMFRIHLRTPGVTYVLYRQNIPLNERDWRDSVNRLAALELAIRERCDLLDEYTPESASSKIIIPQSNQRYDSTLARALIARVAAACRNLNSEEAALLFESHNPGPFLVSCDRPLGANPSSLYFADLSETHPSAIPRAFEDHMTVFGQSTEPGVFETDSPYGEGLSRLLELAFMYQTCGEYLIQLTKDFPIDSFKPTPSAPDSSLDQPSASPIPDT